EYVDFFFKNVTTEEGDIFLIRDPNDLPFMDSLSLDQQFQIRKHYVEPSVEYDRESDMFLVQGVLYFAGVLLKATLTVQPDGIIEISNHAMLMAPGGVN
ncbi:MAG: hypothetical protein KGQ41_08230, partial [Alphaproteobacteria bacterium]|nr:hypothetical protein [Alphaproteobacteria bacterium]